MPCYGIRSTLPANGCSSSIKPLGAGMMTRRRQTAVCARPCSGLFETRTSALEAGVSAHGPRASVSRRARREWKAGPIDADKLLRNILRRALRKAGLPPLRFHDMRHLAGTLMSEAGVPPKRAQEILGHADVRTTLATYTHTIRAGMTIQRTRWHRLQGLDLRETIGKQKAP